MGACDFIDTWDNPTTSFAFDGDFIALVIMFNEVLNLLAFRGNYGEEVMK